MPTPFPGMDPYFEHPDMWRDVHHGLIEALREYLAPQLRPRYRVKVEVRTYRAEPDKLALIGVPGTAGFVSKWYLERFLLDVNRIGHGGFPWRRKSDSDAPSAAAEARHGERLLEGLAGACGCAGRGG